MFRIEALCADPSRPGQGGKWVPFGRYLYRDGAERAARHLGTMYECVRVTSG